MKKRYEWRELTDDGLLREPKDVGPFYDKTNINESGGFESEAAACEAYERFKKIHEYSVPWELVLVAIYRVELDA